MLKDVTFGQYYPTKSFIHNMDPRTKLVLSICFMVGVLFAFSFFSYGIAAAFFLLAVAFSGVPLGKILRSVKPMLFFLVFIFLLNFLSFRENADGGALFFQLGSFRIYENNLFNAIKMVIRFAILIMGMSIMTLTTTPMALTGGLESLLTPLKVIGLPIRELSLIMSIALRFIPVLIEETDKIIKAQKARGAEFDRGGIIKRAKAYIPVLIPMFVSALMRAEELALAMDSRCFGYTKKPTKMKKLMFTWRDALAVIVFVAFFGSILYMKYNPSVFDGCPWMYY